MKQLNYISLFSSAGVGCYGFNQENFKCISTCEIDSKRIEIQKNNQICENPEEYITGDIQEIQIQDRIFNNVRAYKERNNIKDLTLLIATPPCQGISVANHKKKNELNRNSLIVESFKITKKIKPKFFIYENVQSFLKTLCTDIDGELIQIQDAMNKNLLQDYFISSKVVNLKNYGSNSSRTRTIVIGVRRDQKINPERLFPDITEPKLIKELINKLEKLNKFGEISNDIYHSFRPYDKRMLPWIEKLKEGESAFDNKESLRKPHQIIDNKIIINQKKNGDKYKRNYLNQVAPCIHTRNDILASQNTIHPKENRVFSIRELMQFMSIPNDFKWSDIKEETLNLLSLESKKKFLKKNELNIRRCIGEAVPTKVFNNIAKKIKDLSNIEDIGFKDNLQSINKIIKLHNLTNFKNKKAFINKFYNKLDLDFIIKILEFSNPDKEKNSSYFTDSSLSIDILNNIPILKGNIRILEPSVGSGSFLLQLIKKFSHLPSVQIDVFDIDTEILSLLKLLLKKAKLPKNTNINFFNKDFLSYTFKNRYDLVIGNPPFGKIKDKKVLNEYKKHGINIHNNLFTLFLNKSLNLSKNVALVLPKSFISSPEHDQIRSKIEKKNIFSILDFGEYGFKGVKIETIGLILNGRKINDNKVKFYSYANKKYLLQNQDYIIDSKFPYWLLYRNKFFDQVCKKMEFGVFNFFRDRQITKKHTLNKGKIRVLKSRNISNNNIVSLDGYDTYLNQIESFAVSKYLNKKNVYLVPNLTYYPRACKLPENSIVDGSAALIFPKNNQIINNEQIEFFASDEFTNFYRIARNFGTRSLNIDRNSIFFWGLKKTG
jgi:DNA (cytosine-5)-methyltransferase 1